MCSLPLSVSLGHDTLWFCCYDNLLSFGVFCMYEFKREESGRKKKNRVPVNSRKCKRSITVKSEVAAATVRL